MVLPDYIKEAGFHIVQELNPLEAIIAKDEGDTVHRIYYNGEDYVIDIVPYLIYNYAIQFKDNASLDNAKNKLCRLGSITYHYSGSGYPVVYLECHVQMEGYTNIRLHAEAPTEKQIKKIPGVRQVIDQKRQIRGTPFKYQGNKLVRC